MRFKTKWEKILISTAFMLVGIVIIGGSTVKAALQANSTTHDKPISKSGAAWISEIRNMENAGQTMGLSESQNADLSPVGSNNIDVHMMRSTEFGAMAILSASGFGNPKKLSEADPKTTTGNITGVYVTGNRMEWTAGVTSSAAGSVNTRYYDNYATTAGNAYVGDGLGLSTNSTAPGCVSGYFYGSVFGWHGATRTRWLGGSAFGFHRGGEGIFSFTGANGDWAGGGAGGTANSRGVAVVHPGV